MVNSDYILKTKGNNCSDQDIDLHCTAGPEMRSLTKILDVILDMMTRFLP